MKQMMDSIKAVVKAHNDMDEKVKGLTDLFNDTLREHCDLYNPEVGACEGTTCDHPGNEIGACCMAHCPLDKEDS